MFSQAIARLEKESPEDSEGLEKPEVLGTGIYSKTIDVWDEKEWKVAL